MDRWDELTARLNVAETRSAENERRIRALSEVLDRLEKDAASASHVVAARNGEISRLQGECARMVETIDRMKGRANEDTERIAHLEWVVQAAIDASAKIAPFIRDCYIPPEKKEK